MAITRVGLGGPGAAYPGFTPKAEAAVRRAIGGQLRQVTVVEPELSVVSVRQSGLFDVHHGGDD